MNLIFNASAGTGKTWQVTELYAALALGEAHEHLPAARSPVPPDKILLVTFTDNAAAELRARISSRMISAERMAMESGDDETAMRARRILRSLPAANISTIHAFCADLLRERALDAGLSPEFTTLDADECDVLLDEVLRREIFHQLETDPDFRAFCAGGSVLGEHSIIQTIRALIEKAASRGLNLSNAETLLSPPAQTVSRIQLEKIYNELCALGSSSKTSITAQEQLRIAIKTFPNVDAIEKIPKFGRINKELSDESEALKERFLTEYHYEKNRVLFCGFARCLAACATAFTSSKRERDAVDFNDLLLLARDFLNRRCAGAPAFDWIIIDEVQDTSRVQCEMIQSLWTPETSLVICGDRKQSIYAWRSADPNVMPDFETQMAARGGLKTIALKTSYRSKDRVLSAVNELFSEIYGAQYESAALEPSANLNALTAPAGEGACVEFLQPDDEENNSPEKEMEAVARRIKLLATGDSDWRPQFRFDGKVFSDDSSFQYSDILILLKRTKYQPVLEAALRAANIPFSSGGKGRALFEQQEVRDLFLFLQTLCEPENDLALVGYMRSPIANISDSELVQYGWNGETFNREILRRRFFESGAPAADLILRYRALTGEKTASTLVRDAVRETAFDAALAGSAGGEQKLANFKKAIDWLRDVERGGQILLPDVLRRFEKAIQTPPRDGAAEAVLPDPEQNVVTIMTVHGAKGLTKRVCFVPDISTGDVNETGFAVITPDGRLEMKLTALNKTQVLTPGWKTALAADKNVRDLENKNVFYVAMTRARDLIVFSGAGTKDEKGWLKDAEKFIAGAPGDLLRIRKFSEIPEAGEQRAEVRNQEEIEFKPLTVSSNIERKTVTSLCEHKSTISNLKSEISNPVHFGTAGHIVLEELATNNWNGDIPELVELSFIGDTAETELLIIRLEAAREILRRATAGAIALFTEHPFVLKRGNTLLDGTIDLLAQFDNEWKIFDYKFTGDPAAGAKETYQPQLAAYKEAIQKLHPAAAVSATLILIQDTIKLNKI